MQLNDYSYFETAKQMNLVLNPGVMERRVEETDFAACARGERLSTEAKPGSRSAQRRRQGVSLTFRWPCDDSAGWGLEAVAGGRARSPGAACHAIAWVRFAMRATHARGRS